MNKPNMKWNKSTKTTTQGTPFWKAFSLKLKQGTKRELKCFSFKYVKKLSYLARKVTELESHFVILHFKVYVDNYWQEH